MNLAMSAAAMASRAACEIRNPFAFVSLSLAFEGRNAQSTFDTCNALKTNARPLQRAERPGASQFRLSRPAPRFAPRDRRNLLH